MAKARRIDRCLQIHSKHEVIQQKLHVSLRLNSASHQPEAHIGFFAACDASSDKPGYERMEWALARCNRIRQTLRQGESSAAIVQSETGAGNDDARTKVVVVRVDE